MSDPPRKRKRILFAIGSTCVDHFLPLSQFPEQNGKFRIQTPKHRHKLTSELRCIGGNVNNMGYAYANLAHLAKKNYSVGDIHHQGHVKICTVLSKDDPMTQYAQNWYDGWAKNCSPHFDVSNVVWRKSNDDSRQFFMPCTYILVVKDSRTCIHAPCEEMEHLNEKDINAMMGIVGFAQDQDLKEGDMWIYSDTRHGRFVNPLMKLLDNGPFKVPLVLDCEKWRGEDMLQQLNRVKYCFMNSDFLQRFWVENLKRPQDEYTLSDALMYLWDLRTDQESGGFMLRTMGEHGSILIRKCAMGEVIQEDGRSGTYNDIEEFIQDAQKEPHDKAETCCATFDRNGEFFSLIYCTATLCKRITDSTGAGDTYIGTFVHYLQNSSKPLEEIMRLSSKCASWCLEEYGNHFNIEILPDTERR